MGQPINFSEDGDEEACVVCGEHLEEGDLVYWSINDDGHMHADCATAYVDEDGNDTDEPPEPFKFRPGRYAPITSGAAIRQKADVPTAVNDMPEGEKP